MTIETRVPLLEQLPAPQLEEPPTVPPGEDELPYEDDVPMESPSHLKQMNLLIDTLERHLADRDDIYIGGNMGIYFSELQVQKNNFRAPDFFAVLDTTRRDRKSWVVWGEGGKTPSVVIEILSDSTRQVDRGIKRRIYEQLLKVGDYFMFDFEPPTLEGFRLVAGAYEPVVPDAEGRWRVESLNLVLGLWTGTIHTITRTWLRWFTPEGELLLTGDEAEVLTAERAEVERQRAEVERQRAEALAARLAAYEKRFGALDAE